MSARKKSYDAVVIGLGPGGSATALELRQRGLDVLGIEKDSFPRYHIGESLTGTVGGFLRKHGLEERMRELKFPTKYGVTAMGKSGKNEFFVPVAPEPTWQVRRDEFDRMLLDAALAEGTERMEGSVSDVLRDGDRVTGVQVRTASGTESIEAQCVVDCSGLSTVLSRLGVAGPREHEDYASQVAVFTQIRGAKRDPGLMRDNTMIFYNEPHHWAWFIPLDDEVVSVGFVVKLETYRRLRDEASFDKARIPEHVFQWGMNNINEQLRERCEGCEWTEPVRVLRDYCYRIDPFSGPGWLCVGDAHRFLDPIFSFGVSLAIHEGERAGAAIDRAIQTGDWTAPFQAYERYCNTGQDAIADVIRYFWRFPAFFGVQAQGAYRSDIMQLFAGAAYDETPLPGLSMMRESLRKIPVRKIG